MKKVFYYVIGWIEVLIGVMTFFSVLAVAAYNPPGIHAKPLNVMFFVLASSLLSFSLGAGLLRRKRRAVSLLVFFSGYVIIQKILVFSGLASFSGELVSVVPSSVKDAVSIIYHAAIIVFLSRFGENISKGK